MRCPAAQRITGWQGMASCTHSRGVPRSYYVGIESAMPAVPGVPAPLKALTVAPFGMEEGTSIQIPNASSAWWWVCPLSFASSHPRPQNDAPGAFIEEFGDDLQDSLL